MRIVTFILVLFCFPLQISAHEDNQLLCVSGEAFEASGNAVTIDTDVKVKYPSNEICKQAINGSLLCVSGIAYRSSGETIVLDSGVRVEYPSNEICKQSIGASR